MKSIYLFIIVALVSLASCGGEKNESGEEGDESASSALFSNNIDSIVYYTHEVTDMLENELVLEEKDQELQESLMNYDFNKAQFDSLSYYYNSSKAYSKKEDIEKLNGYFHLKDFSDPDPEAMASIYFRDIFLFYKDGNIIGAVKVCFPCGIAAFNCFDKEYAGKLMDEEQKMITDVKGLEEFVTGVHRQP